MNVYTLVNAPTGDDWTQPATLACPGADVVNVSVRNAAVIVQLGEGTAPPFKWSQEFMLTPVDRSFSRRANRPTDGIRFRSAKPGTPARVSVDTG